MRVADTEKDDRIGGYYWLAEVNFGLKYIYLVK